MYMYLDLYIKLVLSFICGGIIWKCDWPPWPGCGHLMKPELDQPPLHLPLPSHGKWSMPTDRNSFKLGSPCHYQRLFTASFTFYNAKFYLVQHTNRGCLWNVSCTMYFNDYQNTLIWCWIQQTPPLGPELLHMSSTLLNWPSVIS